MYLRQWIISNIIWVYWINHYHSIPLEIPFLCYENKHWYLITFSGTKIPLSYRCAVPNRAYVLPVAETSPSCISFACGRSLFHIRIMFFPNCDVKLKPATSVLVSTYASVGGMVLFSGTEWLFVDCRPHTHPWSWLTLSLGIPDRNGRPCKAREALPSTWLTTPCGSSHPSHLQTSLCLHSGGNLMWCCVFYIPPTPCNKRCFHNDKVCPTVTLELWGNICHERRSLHSV
jgi:hypothetical protein